MPHRVASHTHPSCGGHCREQRSRFGPPPQAWTRAPATPSAPRSTEKLFFSAAPLTPSFDSFVRTKLPAVVPPAHILLVHTVRRVRSPADLDLPRHGSKCQKKAERNTVQQSTTFKLDYKFYISTIIYIFNHIHLH